MKSVAALILFLITAQGALADEKPTPEQIAQLRSENIAIVASDKNTTSVFAVQDDGTVKHIQSGMICPATLSNGTFYHALVFDDGKGLDVGCDYRRADDKGGADFKLTLFAVKSQADTKLESAFAHYRDEVLQTDKDAKSVGPAITIQNNTGGSSKLPEIRSEQFMIWFNDRDYTTEVVVALVRGWVFEIRATYTGKPNELAANSAENVKYWTRDRAASSLALLEVADTLGR